MYSKRRKKKLVTWRERKTKRLCGFNFTPKQYVCVKKRLLQLNQTFTGWTKNLILEDLIKNSHDQEVLEKISEEEKQTKRFLSMRFTENQHDLIKKRIAELNCTSMGFVTTLIFNDLH